MTNLEQYKSLIELSDLNIQMYKADINKWHTKELFAGHLLLTFQYKCEGYYSVCDMTGGLDLVFTNKYILIDDICKECGESEDFDPDEITELELLIGSKINFL